MYLVQGGLKSSSQLVGRALLCKGLCGHGLLVVIPGYICRHVLAAYTQGFVSSSLRLIQAREWIK